MRHQELVRIVLPLGDLQELFTAPDFDPNNDRVADNAHTDPCEVEIDELYEPGIDYLVSYLLGRRLARQGQLVLVMPAAHLQPDLAHKARKAIDRYCRHK